MRAKKQITLIILTAMQACFLANAQDVHFSQFYMAPLKQNPALAGAKHDVEAILNYRNQWQSIAFPYRTFAFSYDMRITKPRDKRGFWAAGISFYSDNASAQVKTTEGSICLAYHVNTGKYSYLGAGAMGGYAQRVVNYSTLTWGSQYDGMEYNSSLPSDEPAVSNSISYIDAAAGINWCYDNTSGNADVTDNHDKKADVGFAMFHVNQPKYSFFGDNEKLNIRYVFHADGLVSIANSNFAIRPGILYYRQGTAQEVLAGTMVRYMLRQSSKYTGVFKSAALSIGGYYRAGDAAIASMLLEYSKYALGVSYDINTSKLTTASKGRGGVEISFRYVLPNPFGGLAHPTNSMF